MFSKYSLSSSQTKDALSNKQKNVQNLHNECLPKKNEDVKSISHKSLHTNVVILSF